MAAFSPSWASEIKSLVPFRPRLARLFRKADQKVSASEGPMCRPTISRRPSVLTATATIAGTETMRPLVPHRVVWERRRLEGPGSVRAPWWAG